MEHVDLKETSGVVLAYLGDAVWELCIRKYWISKGLCQCQETERIVQGNSSSFRGKISNAGK